MKRFYFFILFFFLISIRITAQVFHFNQFNNAVLLLCPANAGVSKNFRLAMNYNSQTNFYLSYDQNTSYKKGLGVFYFSTTNENQISQKNVELDYNFKFKTSRFSRLSTGIGLNYKKIYSLLGNEEKIYNVAFSSTFYTRKWATGLTLRNLVPYKENSFYPELQKLTISYFAGMRYYFIENKIIRRRKNANVRMLVAAFTNLAHYQFNTEFLLSSKAFSVGTAYGVFSTSTRPAACISGIVGTTFPKLSITYSYNFFPASGVRFHEISLLFSTKISFDFQSDRKEFKHPLT